MLLIIKLPQEMDIPQLLAIYRESSLENCQGMYPEEPTMEAALARYESEFGAWMGGGFFEEEPGRYWMVESANGVWVSTLRLFPMKEPRTWLVDGLETHPDHRKQGHASRLLTETIRALEEEHGDIVLFAGVGKRNIASLQTHLRSGFVREKETWTEDGEATDRQCTMAYRSARR